MKKSYKTFWAGLFLLLPLFAHATVALYLSGMGYNANGQLGNGTTSYFNTSPVLIAHDVIFIAAGGQHTLYIDANGMLWATGSNSAGQLGDGTTTNRLSPVQVASGVASAAGGYTHSLFLKTDGTLWAMGDNQYGELGDGTTINRPSPVQVASNRVLKKSQWF
jgi:alpha-tubulin suppressor-like RCC1 family protein